MIIFRLEPELLGFCSFFTGIYNVQSQCLSHDDFRTPATSKQTNLEKKIKVAEAFDNW